MRGDCFLAEPLAQVRASTRSAIRRVLTKISVVRWSPISSASRSIDLLPHLVRHHRFERRRRHLDREIARAAMADVDDRAVGRVAVRGADQEARDCRRSASAWPTARCAASRPAAQRLEPLERQREMAAALVRRDRMDLVDDHRAHGRQHRAAGLRAEQHVERFGRRHQDVRRRAAHRARARPRACRRCARRCGSRRPASPAPQRRRGCRRAALRGCCWMSFDSALSGET